LTHSRCGAGEQTLLPMLEHYDVMVAEEDLGGWR
jgi:hypothetical protein